MVRDVTGESVVQLFYFVRSVSHYEHDDIADQLFEEIDNDADNDFAEYDDTPVDNQALLDDIFGIDSVVIYRYIL
jgi:hypothetical protein